MPNIYKALIHEWCLRRMRDNLLWKHIEYCAVMAYDFAREFGSNIFALKNEVISDVQRSPYERMLEELYVWW